MKRILFTTLALLLAVGLSTPVSAGSVGLWHLDEGSGTTASDSSGNGNDGTLLPSSSEPTWVSGMFGYALSFDGTDDYVDCGNVLDVTNKLTVEAWVMDSGHSGGNAVGKFESMSERWHIYINSSGSDDKIYWNVGGGLDAYGAYGTSSTDDIGTDWHYLAMVYDGTQTGNENRLRAYIDGQSISLSYSGTIPETLPEVSGNVNLGRHSTSNFFEGIIDEVRIWDEALTAEQIAQRYIDPVVTTEITSGESEVGVGAEESWDITIRICGGPECVESVVVQNGMGADLDGIVIQSYDGVSADWEKKGKKNQGATMVIWEVGDLDAGECAELVVTVTTGFNAKDKHSFTSVEDDHALDGGASAVYSYDSVVYKTLETQPLTIDVVAPRLYLYQKDPADWSIINSETTWGLMTYNFKGHTFDFDFAAVGLENDIGYSLIYYPEPPSGWPAEVTVIANGTSDGSGNLALTGSYEFGQDLNNAKIWLVLTDDIVGGSLSGWQPARYLFEHNLITYYNK